MTRTRILAASGAFLFAAVAGAGAQGEAREQEKVEGGKEREDGGAEVDRETGKLGRAPVAVRRGVRPRWT